MGKEGVSPVSRLYELVYLGGDMYLMPSKYEPAGLSQLEAIAAGTPAIARDIDGLSTSVIDVAEAQTKGISANGFKFFRFTPEDLERCMKRAINVYKGNQENGISWNDLVYNCLTYDSRWIKPAKGYVNGIFAKNADVDLAHIADIPELILIFGEPEENLEYNLIKHGYNTERGLDHVLEDALAELKKHIKDERPLVADLAKKYYDKYKNVKHLKNAPALQQEGEPDNSSAYADLKYTKALFNRVMPAQLEEGRSYEIKYDTARLSPSQVEIIEEYIKLLKLRASALDNIKGHPFSSQKQKTKEETPPLIEVYCRGKGFDGKGSVDVSIQDGKIDEYLLRVVAMVNMAIAASNLPKSLTKDNIGQYMHIINFIRNQYRAMLGTMLVIPNEPDDISKALRKIILDLPPAYKIPFDEIEKYNTLVKKILIAA